MHSNYGYDHNIFLHPHHLLIYQFDIWLVWLAGDISGITEKQKIVALRVKTLQFDLSCLLINGIIPFISQH